MKIPGPFLFGGVLMREAILRRSSRRLCLLGAFLVGGCVHRSPDVTFLAPDGPPKYPFSPAVQVGSLLYLAGQIGTDSTGALVRGGLEAEAHQTMRNIAEVLAKTGSSMDRVVKCTVFLLDMKEWPAFNTIYASYFPGNKPARSALGANGLALGSRVEVECLAVVAR